MCVYICVCIYIHTHRHIYVMVWAWVGKEFPDTRQDKRRIKFIRVGWGESPKKAMAPHSSTLAWKIPWMEEPGRL